MNNERILETGPSPRIHIEAIGGNLTLRGSEQDAVYIQADPECRISSRSRPRHDSEPDTDTAKRDIDERDVAEQDAGEQDKEAATGESSSAQAEITEIHITCPDDCLLTVPYMAEVHIQAVGGDCAIDEVSGSISIGKVGGNLHTSATAEIEVETVGGDYRLHSADGDVTLRSIGGNLNLHEAGSLSLDTVGGDARLQSIHGNVAARWVGGNLRGRGISGSLAVETGGDLSLTNVKGNIQAQVRGNAQFNLALKEEQAVQIHANGDLHGRIPHDAAAVVRLHGSGEVLVRGLPVTTQGGREQHLILGNGETQPTATLNLEARGNLLLEGVHNLDADETAFGPGWEFGDQMGDFAERVSRQMEIKMEQLSRQLEQRFTKLGDNEELAARVQEKVQNAMRQAEQKIARALEKAESRTKRAEERMARREGRRHVYSYSRGTPPTPPAPPTPPKPPKSPRSAAVTEEERLRILRMVESGIINVEQAEKLLAALNK